jgi:hypothetical protein
MKELTQTIAILALIAWSVGAVALIVAMIKGKRP